MRQASKKAISSPRRITPITSLDPAPSLTAEAYRLLRWDILAGRLKPGEKLKLDVLRDRYGGGATPLREALSQLSAEGLVDRQENRGFRVKPASAADFRNLLEARCIVEAAAVRLAIANGSEAWEDTLVVAESRLARLDRPVLNDDIAHEWESAHRRFHMALIDAAANPHLLEMCGRLYDRAIRYRALATTRAYPARDIETEHKAIVAAALDRDADRAVESLLSHYRQTGTYLIEALK